MIEVSVSNGAEMPNIGIFSVASIAYWIHFEQKKNNFGRNLNLNFPVKVTYGNVFRKYPIWFPDDTRFGGYELRIISMSVLHVKQFGKFARAKSNFVDLLRSSQIHCTCLPKIHFCFGFSFYFNRRWNLLVVFNFWCFLLCIFCVFCLQFWLNLALVWWY